MKLYDITRELNESIAVWPGDVFFSKHQGSSIDNGDVCNQHSYEMSAHAGTHVDAPYHFVSDAKKISEIPLETFIGPAAVIHVEGPSALKIEHFKDVDFAKNKRILIKTEGSKRSNNQWVENFSYLLPETARFLLEKEVLLVGIDTFSVDKLSQTQAPVHEIFLGNNIVILENLQLEDITAGEYELLAQPLKIAADGSPVRAVLRR